MNMSITSWDDLPDIDMYQFKLREMSKPELITLVNQQCGYIKKLQGQNKELQEALRNLEASHV